MTDSIEPDGPPASAEPPDGALPPEEAPVAPPYEPHLELEPASELALDPEVPDDEPLPLPLAARVVSTSTAPVASAIPMLAGRRQFARTTPVVVDRGRATFGFPTLGDRRQLGQIGLVVLMVAALGALLFARQFTPDTSGLGRAGSPSPHGSIAASPKTSPRPSATPPISPGTSVSPVPVSPTPSPTTRPQTYTVKSGDTLSGIAVRFHTTAKIIEQLNGIKSPYVIHPGEILKLP